MASVEAMSLSTVRRLGARSSAMADIAVGQPIGFDAVVGEHRLMKSGNLLGRLPVGIENGLLRTEVRRRVAMTAEAPFHLHRLFAPGQRHMVHRAMAGDAGDTLIHVNGVVEIDEIA